MRVLGMRGCETACWREGRGFGSAMLRRGTLVDDVLDIQLGDGTEERVVIIPHLEHEV